MEKWLNPKVKAYFKNSPEDIEQLDFNNPDHIAKRICLHQPNDTMTLTLFRFVLFVLYINQHNFLGDYYAIPRKEFNERVQFVPQVCLYFCETQRSLDEKQKIEPNATPAVQEVSFRLLNWQQLDFSKPPREIPEIKEMAKKIRTNFVEYTYDRGVYNSSYSDPGNGYRLRIRYRSRAEVKELIRLVLDLQGFKPEYARNFKSDGKEDEPDIYNETTGKVEASFQEKKRLFGELRELYPNRTVGEMELYKATLTHRMLDEPELLAHRFSNDNPIETLF